MNGRARFDANVKPKGKMKFTEEIDNRISFIEIIVIIIKAHIQRSCNKYFLGICIFKIKRLF